jgi:perosamine synthetase
VIPIYKPYLPAKSIEYAKDALDSGWVSSIGEYIERAEAKLAEQTKSKYAILVNNGTSATHLCARVLKRWHPNTERVFVPSACYVAVYNCLMYDQFDWDIQPLDLDKDTWNMKLPESYEPGDALMAVHNVGNVMNLDKVECPIVEDSCETLFGCVKQPKSICASLSFFGNKSMTSGEGGALVTDDSNVADFIRKLKGQGQTTTRYVHDELGYNYRMTNVQAALLLGQLEEWGNIFSGKDNVFKRYNEHFKDYPNIIPQKVDLIHSRWMYGVRIIGSKSYADNREFFAGKGIDTRPMFYPYTHHKHLEITTPESDKVAEELHKEIVILPSYPELTDIEIEKIAYAVIKRSKEL